MRFDRSTSWCSRTWHSGSSWPCALEFTGGGEVTDHEKFDEESLYEVEVLLPNGDRVDVQLDGSFNVVGHEVDGPGDEDD